jgi:hypothetical protein
MSGREAVRDRENSGKRSSKEFQYIMIITSIIIIKI